MKSYFSIDCTHEETTIVLWRVIPETDEEELLISLSRQKIEAINSGICDEELYEKDEVGKRWYLFRVTGIVPKDIQESNKTFSGLKGLCKAVKNIKEK